MKALPVQIMCCLLSVSCCLCLCDGCSCWMDDSQQLDVWSDEHEVRWTGDWKVFCFFESLCVTVCLCYFGTLQQFICFNALILVLGKVAFKSNALQYYITPYCVSYFLWNVMRYITFVSLFFSSEFDFCKVFFLIKKLNKKYLFVGKRMCKWKSYKPFSCAAGRRRRKFNTTHTKKLCLSKVIFVQLYGWIGSLKVSSKDLINKMG